jgi:hypothetical protein
MKTYSKRSNKEEYNAISIDLTPLPWNCKDIEYSVSQINFTANYYITTDLDYIYMAVGFPDWGIYEYSFQNLTDFDLDNITTYLQTTIFRDEITVTKMPNGRLRFVNNPTGTRLKIVSISRRARWFIGFMRSTTLDLDDDFDYLYDCDQPPSTTFGNLLYLTSLQGEIVNTNTDSNILLESPILYRINQFMRPGLPVIINKKQSKIISNPISKIDLQLTDCYFEPIILLSPLYVAIEVRPFPHYK